MRTSTEFQMDREEVGQAPAGHPDALELAARLMRDPKGAEYLVLLNQLMGGEFGHSRLLPEQIRQFLGLGEALARAQRGDFSATPGWGRERPA